MPHLAQLNIARMKYAMDDPEFADFVEALDPVNASADRSPGFIWRLVSEEHGSPALTEFEASGWLVNMSVWESVRALRDFVRSPGHFAVMKRRAEWFEKVDVYLCLWWVDEGYRPGFEEALERLEHLRQHGPTPRAFDFTRIFEPG